MPAVPVTFMIQPPTGCLPPIASVATLTSPQLSDALQYLHSLYLPQVRGSRRRRRDEKSRSVSSLEASNDDVRLVQSDPFERAYAIRWLTALIAQLEACQNQSPSSPTVDAGVDHLTEQAASLLAACAGVAAAGKVQHRFAFRSTLSGEIHVALTDIPLDNDDYASVGAQTWGGACVLAEMIAEHPDQFGLGSARRRLDGGPSGRVSQRPLRVLELGAGTGLVGLTVAKVLQALYRAMPGPTLPHRATVALTDVYPAVLDNLQSNIDANFPTALDDSDIVVCSHPLDWSSFSAMETKPDILSTRFDVVFGADIAYEVQHAPWIRDCLNSLLAYPDVFNEEPVFHLVIPLRPTHMIESSTVEEIFGSKGRVPQPELTIFSKECFVCEAYGYEGSDRGLADDEVEYVHYRIGWTR